MTFEYNNFVRCTKEEAWQLITDLERRPDWIHFQEKVYWTEKKEGMVGSRYQEIEVFLGIHLNINYEVTEWKENEQISSRCLMPPLYPVVDVFVKEKPGGVESTLRFSIKLGPFELIPKFILKKQVDNIIQPMVDSFKKILESESSLRNK